jgi:hypothetical protein
MVLVIDVARSRPKLWNAGQFDASGVVFKDGTAEGQSRMGDWNALGGRFFEEVHHGDRVSESLAECDILGFGGAVSNFGLQS